MDYDLKLAIEHVGSIKEAACSSAIISHYPVTKVLWAKQTPYAEAVIAEVPSLGKCLFLDSEIQSSESDEVIYHECLVHPIMMAAPKRSNVLIIGGGEGATVREVMRWPDVERVVWVDIDGELVEACSQILKWLPKSVRNDPRVVYKAMDIREFFKQTKDVFDIAIIDLPDPDISLSKQDPENLQNLDFWKGLRKVLSFDGVFATHVGPTLVFAEKDGYSWTIQTATEANHALNPGKYHAFIPSFQSDWSFLLSCKPRFDKALPEGLRFMNLPTLKYVFQWPEPVM